MREKGKMVSALVLAVLALFGLAHQVAGQDGISGADTSWLLVSMSLVLLMTPGLALFYGGLVNARNALNTMMMSFVALGAVGVAWAVAGYSLAFGEGSALAGDLSMAFLRGVGLDANGSIPDLLFMGFQGTFAIITAALISGALIGRMRFGPYVAFIVLWGLAVYAPVAHWVWGGGWLSSMGALDFAGGAVVHVNAGAAAFAAALVLGKRNTYGREAILPHSVPFVLIGAGLLWFGWFGFNGGSALAADGIAALASVNTLLAPAGTLVVWALLDHYRSGTVTGIGVATAIVVGLVAVTPAAGFVSPMSALIIGGVAALPSYYMLQWRPRTPLDDSLDVVAAHGVGGMTGAILTGVFADAAVNGSVDGLLTGNPGQLVPQAVSVVAVFAYSAIITLVLLKAISVVRPLRPSLKDEGRGMDIVNHGEEAYARGDGALLLLDSEINGNGGA